MKTYFKILKFFREKTPRKRSSVAHNNLNLTIPRKPNFSGHFHLNTFLFRGDWLKVAMRN